MTAGVSAQYLPVSIELNPRSGCDIVKDSVHGYLRFTRPMAGLDEVTEKDLIDSPWVQRLRRVRQLQGAWYVYPSADHSRFIHSLAVMELAGLFAKAVYEPYYSKHPRRDALPAPCVVVETLRLAGLLHDVGHGPFSHRLDDAYFKPHCGGLTHEKISAWIIQEQLSGLIRGIKRTPDGERLPCGESIDPMIVANLVDSKRHEDLPSVWRPLGLIIDGAYDADKMDFVLRDGSACGIAGVPPEEVQRLIATSFLADLDDAHPLMFLDEDSKIPLWLFLRQRQHLTEAVYYHRTVRALEHMVEPAVVWAVDQIVTGVPLQEAYQYCDESQIHVMLCEAARGDHAAQVLSACWTAALARQVPWKRIFEKTEPKERLPRVDEPDPKRLHAAIVEALEGGVPETAVWVDTPVSRAPKEVSVLKLHSRVTNRHYTPSLDELIDNGVFGYRVFFRVYLHKDYSRHTEAVTAASRGTFGEENSEDTSW
jgi:hypothetical protein